MIPRPIFPKLLLLSICLRPRLAKVSTHRRTYYFQKILTHDDDNNGHQLLTLPTAASRHPSAPTHSAMSPYPATRRNGVCTGSLWKSHSRFRGSSAKTTSPVNTVSSPEPGLDPPDPSVSFDDILAEANERQRTHEFCVLVGNIMWSYSDVWAYAKGDPPTVRPQYLFHFYKVLPWRFSDLLIICFILSILRSLKFELWEHPLGIHPRELVASYHRRHLLLRLLQTIQTKSLRKRTLLALLRH